MSLVVPFNEIFAKEIGLLAKHHTWERIEIKFVAEIINGFAFKSNLFSKNKGFPIIRIRDISKGKLETYYTGDYSEEYVVLPGDLLIGMDGNFICCGWKGREGLLNQRVCKIITNEKYLIKKFLLYGINGYLSAIHKATSSVTVAHLSSLDIARIPFPLPPLNEQRRIVAKLEKLLAKVDTCKERLDKIPAILKRFRQSVLSAACSGRLTADWRENNPDVESVSEIISSLKTPYPDIHFDTFQESSACELPQSWMWVPLGKLGILTGGGTPSTKNPDFWTGSIPWVSAKDMKQDRISDSIDHISEDAIKYSSTRKIPQGAIIFVVRGMILNHTLPVAIIDKVVTINQDIKALIPENYDMSEYLFIAIKSVAKNILFSVKEATHGTRRIETPVLKNWAIPIPPLAEQQEIVRRVETLFKTADKIEQRYQKARTYIDQLTQSILAKAFRGELVPQDSNDEPASVLLERIRAERENRENVAKTAKKPAKKQRSKKAQPQLEPIQLELPGMESNF